MSEKQMRRKVVQILKPLDAQSVENLCAAGMPDVNYCWGWIELKKLPAWPKREDTIVRIDHFTQQQRIWLLRRWQMSRNAWLLVQIEQDWMIFDGKTAAQHVGKSYNKKEMLFHAYEAWNRENPVNPGLRELLKNANP